jgi:hypothetical protein
MGVPLRLRGREQLSEQDEQLSTMMVEAMDLLL